MPVNRLTDPKAAKRIIERLKETEHLLSPITEADGEEARFQRTCRDHLVKDLINRAKVLESPPKVFCSYSDTAKVYFTQAQKLLQKNKAFKAMNWRVSERKGQAEVGKVLAQQISACSCFLGIWVNPKGRAKTKNAKRGFAPSPWMPYELGIARGSGAICVVLVHEDIDEQFLREPNLGEINEQFSDEQSFARCLNAAKEVFEEQLRGRRPRWTWDTPLDQNYYKDRETKYWRP